MASYVTYKVMIENFKILDVDDEVVKNGGICYEETYKKNGVKNTLTVSLQEIEDENDMFYLKITSDKDLFKEELMRDAENAVRNLINNITFHFPHKKASEPVIVDTVFKDQKMGKLKSMLD